MGPNLGPGTRGPGALRAARWQTTGPYIFRGPIEALKGETGECSAKFDPGLTLWILPGLTFTFYPQTDAL